MAKFCPTCGNNVSEKNTFCTECGTDLSSHAVYAQKTATNQIHITEYSNEFSDGPKRVGNLTKLSGIVSNIGTTSTIYGSVNTNVNGYVSGSINTIHRTYFRVNNHPCRCEFFLNINNGDRVTVAGEDLGELYLWAVRNESTNLIYRRITVFRFTMGMYLLLVIALPGVFGILEGLSMLSSNSSVGMTIIFLSTLYSLFFCGLAWYVNTYRQKMMICAQLVEE